MSGLDFEATIDHLHGLLGRHVSVTFLNHGLPDHQAFAGFRGRLRHTAGSELDRHDPADHDRVDTFYSGDDGLLDRSWFTLDERTFRAAQVNAGDQLDRIDEQLAISVQGGDIVVAVFTDAYVESRAARA